LNKEKTFNLIVSLASLILHYIFLLELFNKMENLQRVYTGYQYLLITLLFIISSLFIVFTHYKIMRRIIDGK